MAVASELIQAFPVVSDGITASCLPGVRLFQTRQPMRRQPMIYDPGLCIIIQGHKIGFLGEHAFQYDANHYLVTSVAMPFECETFASPEVPVRGLFIDIDMSVLIELIGKLDPTTMDEAGKNRALPRGIGPASMDKEMQDSLLRLLKSLRSSIDAQILGPSLIREILFRALRGNQAPILCSLAMNGGSFSQVARALNRMRTGYAEPLDVTRLAKAANLSVSAFHRAFKEITSDSPIQYLKKIRLAKARELILQGNMKAYMAADKVGYESASQFSREFKRYFGESVAALRRERRAG